MTNHPGDPYDGSSGGWAPPPPASGYTPQPDHPQAVTVLVLGLLSVLLCQVVGPFAWVMGKRVLGEIDASQGRVGGRTSAMAGYVMGIIATLMLVVGLVFLVLAVGLLGVSFA